MNRIDLLGAPLLVSWQITRDCDLCCLHCCTESAPGKRLPDELDADEAMRVADEIIRVGVPYVMLCGGEPLVVPHFLALAEKPGPLMRIGRAAAAWDTLACKRGPMATRRRRAARAGGNPRSRPGAVDLPLGHVQRVAAQVGRRKRKRVEELDLAVRDDEEHRLRAVEARLDLGDDASARLTKASTIEPNIRPRAALATWSTTPSEN